MYGLVRAREMRREWGGCQATTRVLQIQTCQGSPRKVSCCWRRCNVKAILHPGKGEGWSKRWFGNVFSGREACLCLQC